MLVSTSKPVMEGHATPIRFHMTKDEVLSAIGSQALKDKSLDEISEMIRANVTIEGDSFYIKFGAEHRYKLGRNPNSKDLHFKILATDQKGILAPISARAEVQVSVPTARVLMGKLPNVMLRGRSPEVPQRSAPAPEVIARKFVSVTHPQNFEDDLEAALSILNDVLKTTPEDAQIKFSYGAKANVLKAHVTRPKIIGG